METHSTSKAALDFKQGTFVHNKAKKTCTLTVWKETFQRKWHRKLFKWLYKWVKTTLAINPSINDLASNFSLQYPSGMKHQGYENKGNDQQQ